MTEKYQLHRNIYGFIKEAQDPTMKAMADWLGGVLSAADEGKPIVYNQFTFWCDSMVAMDLPVLAPELWALAPGAKTGEPMLDAAHEAGVPSEMCWAGRWNIGAQLLGDIIPPPAMMVLPSYPCDNCRIAYQVMQELTGAPLYTVDCPYWIKDDEEAMEYWVNQYKGLISFMEEHSGRKLDYDRLKEVAEETNRYTDYWLEGQEVMKLKPLPQKGPFAGQEILTNIGTPAATEAVKARLDALKERVAKGETAVPEEKVRVIWNYLPVLWYPGLFDWMAEEFGAVICVTINSWTPYEPIDTSTPESIIRGMAKRALDVYMARQGRGAADILIEDSLNSFEQYQADCIIVNCAFGCKWLRNSWGFLRDACRERGIPAMMFDNEIADERVVGQEEVRARIGTFLDTVMAR